MKGIFRKISYITLAGVLAVSISACGNTNTNKNATNNKGAVESKEETKNEKAYSTELAKYFPQAEGTVLNYNGTAEYGHILTLNKITEGNDKLTLNFKGEIQDMSEGEGEASKKDLLFETQYEIGNDYAKGIENSQSIIKEHTVLKLPLEEGNSWEEKVSIEGKEYTAKTKIIEIAQDEDGKNLVKTETVINDMEYYPENTYKEVKTFKEGKGLKEFQNIILFSAAYEGDKDAHMEFGYHLYESK